MKIKSRPENFRVEEVLNQPLKSEGKHRVYRLYKKGFETLPVLKRIARESSLSFKLISFGGIKDKNAETVQFISVPAKFHLKEISLPNLKLKEAGFLDLPVEKAVLGNRFTILVEGVEEIPEERLKVLKDFGFPNYYGEQRFTSVRNGELFVQHLKNREKALLFLFKPAGWESSRERKGKKAFLNGDYATAEKLLSGWRKRVAAFLKKGGTLKEAFKLIPEEELEFQMNVFQSLLFNEKLKSLIENSGVETLKFRYRAGELLFPLRKVEIPGELPSYTPGSEVYRKEVQKVGVDEELLKPYQNYFHNFSRKTAVKPNGFNFEELPQGFLFKFFLPKGSYATVPLRFIFSSV